MSSLLEQLIHWDQLVFLKVNTEWTHPLLDYWMPLITALDHNYDFLYFVLVPFLILFFLLFRKRALSFLIWVALTVLVTDAANYQLIKKNIDRPRPERSLEHVELRVPSHSGPSFPSNHAANNFAGATVASHFFPHASAIFFLIAAAVSYSRVYVGVHFPLDVLAGALVGILVGLIVLKFKSALGLSREKS